MFYGGPVRNVVTRGTQPNQLVFPVRVSRKQATSTDLDFTKRKTENHVVE